ncbi:uncharacterized protein LY89DRAFT_393538 [Mollisia scopiformis]|uniref:Uncharacterized protein n=1 Tax=Mollisia scopiformis TaxID=149040 RepID=A0A194XPH7_MOLSC|nr:uncharacterized protein LY89DRAFT_393538 [Mollisia scopiformis]KUJ22093.1 hypothetical protein LY89DRAFT_393538 [Mollisia scopiformis]
MRGTLDELYDPSHFKEPGIGSNNACFPETRAAPIISPWLGNLLTKKEACSCGFRPYRACPFASGTLRTVMHEWSDFGFTLRPGHNSFCPGRCLGSSLSGSRCRLAKRCRFGDHVGIYILPVHADQDRDASRRADCLGVDRTFIGHQSMGFSAIQSSNQGASWA